MVSETSVCTVTVLFNVLLEVHADLMN